MRTAIWWLARAAAAVAGLTAVTGAIVLGATWYFAANGYDAANMPKTDAIVVLSAGVTLDGGPDVKSAARVEAGIDLWRAGVAPALVFTGGVDPATQQVYSEGMARHARALGAPGAALTLETKAISTFENARFTIDILRDRGWRRITLVTDDYHLLRSPSAVLVLGPHRRHRSGQPRPSGGPVAINIAQPSLESVPRDPGLSVQHPESYRSTGARSDRRRPG